MIREKEIEWLNQRIRTLSIQLEQCTQQLALLGGNPPPEEKIEVSPDTVLVLSDFTVRARNTIKNMGIQTVGELASLTRKKLKSQNNLGKKSIKEIEDFLWHRGFTLRGDE